MDTFGKRALALLAGIAALGYAIAFTTLANAQEPQAWRGILCDTPVQVERVVTLGVQHGGAVEGIKAVNAEIGGDSHACIYASVVGVRGPPLSTINSPDGLLDVVSFQVTKVVWVANLDSGLMVVLNIELPEAKTWYTLTGSTARGA